MTNKGRSVIINSTKNSEKKKFLKIVRKGGFGPMDSSEFTIQYVGGMANVKTCDESLYHRV